MKKALFAVALISIIVSACGQGSSNKARNTVIDRNATNTTLKSNSEGKTISERFAVPEGYKRVASDSTSFSSYLRQLPLKPHGSKVIYYDGRIKSGRNIYEAVVDLPIGKRDLHQCADAVMRLRAAYLFSQKMYDSIHFNFTNGFRADYVKWKNGQRISVKGNQVKWIQAAKPSNSYNDFWKYLEMVFSYAGTASLEKELKTISLEEMRIGDVFIQGGFPGHAVIVVDMAIKEFSGKKVFLLAQSYMPAQEIQLLKNPKDSNLSPWYATNFGTTLITPEWKFKKTDLKRFQ